MKEHNLKLEIQYFEDAICGKKTFEVRFDDRQFMEGDRVVLREWDSEKKDYTGRLIGGYISYVLRDFHALQEGYVAFSYHPNEIIN